MKRMLVAEQWDDYARTVVPANASREQRWETRRAFYAGGSAVLFRLIAVFSPDGEPTPEDLKIMDEVYRELVDFNEAVKAGRA